MERAQNGNAGGQLRLFLLGPLRLVDGSGTDVTPSSGLQRAILAVLALAPRGAVSRARLQDLFWGEKDPTLAAQSLRTALHALRRSLASLPVAILDIDETSVALKLGVVEVDLLSLSGAGGAVPVIVPGEAPDVLEGLNPRIGGGAEVFEDWLRTQRSFWADRIETLAAEVQSRPQVAPVPAADWTPDPACDSLIVGLLVPQVEGGGPRARFMADAVLDRLAMSLRDHLGVRICDYRELGGDIEMAGMIDEPALYLRLRLYQEADWTSLRIAALGPGCREMAWSAECDLGALGAQPIEESAAEFFAEVVTLSAESVHRVRRDGREARISPFHAMNVMFQLDRPALGDLRRQLDESWERTADPVYLSLAAYLNTFRVGESWGAFDAELRDETRALLGAGALQRSHNGLARALAGHAAGFILHDREAADDWLTQALRLSPQSAFGWDHLALHRTYAGRYGAAQEAAQRAIRLGGGSPIRFTYEQTRCMIATLQGRFAEAGDIGRAVLSRRPDYPPALRYSVVSLAHAGQIEAAQQMLEKVRTVDPGFSAEWVDQNRMALVAPEARQLLRAGLARAGA